VSSFLDLHIKAECRDDLLKSRDQTLVSVGASQTLRHALVDSNFSLQC